MASSRTILATRLESTTVRFHEARNQKGPVDHSHRPKQSHPLNTSSGYGNVVTQSSSTFAGRYIAPLRSRISIRVPGCRTDSRLLLLRCLSSRNRGCVPEPLFLLIASQEHRHRVRVKLSTVYLHAPTRRTRLRAGGAGVTSWFGNVLIRGNRARATAPNISRRDEGPLRNLNVAVYKRK